MVSATSSLRTRARRAATSTARAKTMEKAETRASFTKELVRTLVDQRPIVLAESAIGAGDLATKKHSAGFVKLTKSIAKQEKLTISSKGMRIR